MDDVGTELNDEVPEHTAFFGQSEPDSGVPTNDPIMDHPGFMPPGSGGILDDPMFENADFLAPGYETLRFSFTFLDRAGHVRRSGIADGNQETMPNDSPAIGRAMVHVKGFEDSIRVHVVARKFIGDVFAAHLHVAPEGQDGPIVLGLSDDIHPIGQNGILIVGEYTAEDLVGPFAGESDPIGALMAELVTGGVYVNIHTDEYPAGEIRGQL